MRSSQLGVVLGALASLHMAAAAAVGGLVTFEFAGEITSFKDDSNLLDGAVTVGTPFFGSYTFESTTPDSDPEPRRGIYENAVVSMLGEVGGLPFTGPIDGSTTIRVDDAFSTSDVYVVEGRVEFISYSLDIGFGLIDGSGTAFAGDGLPVSPPELALFDHLIFEISDRSEELGFTVVGELNTLVPEPSTLVMLAVGLAGLAGPRRSRASAQ